MLSKLYIWFLISSLKWFYGYGKIKTKTIYVQAWHETGGFTSSIFKENKNLFGMRQAKIRQTTATGTKRSHATYKSLFDSVRDYFYRQKNFKISSKDDDIFMTETVKSGYAEDKSYLTKWKSLMTTVKLPSLLARGGFFFLLLFIIYQIYKLIFQRNETVTKG